MDASGDVFFIGVYVDDIVLAGRSDERIKDAIAKRFEIKDMGQLHYFLGMTVIQNERHNSVWIGQPTYTEKILKKFGMQDCKPIGTPVDVSSSRCQLEIISSIKRRRMC